MQIDEFKRKIINKVYKIVGNIHYGSFGKHSKIIKPLRIIGKKNIYVGDDVHILNGARMETHNYPNGCIRIGNHTSIEQFCHIIASSELLIGEHCVISSCVFISDCNHNYDEYDMLHSRLISRKTSIGNHVFIGTGAKIMPGVTIGDYAIIGANSVVTKNVPSYEIWAGVPAKCINTRHMHNDK